jgi:hypothetical protein
MRLHFKIATALTAFIALLAAFWNAAVWIAVGGFWLACLIAIMGIFDFEAREAAAKANSA